MNAVLPKAFQLQILDDQMGGADFTGAKLHLFKNDLLPDDETVLADFVAADFSGYAAKTLTWGDAYFDSNGVPVSSAGEQAFEQTGATGCLVYGGWVTDTAGTKLLWSARLPNAPQPLVDAGDVLPLIARSSIDGGLLITSPNA